jgi:Ca2+-binding EF-hand superfamily protein
MKPITTILACAALLAAAAGCHAQSTRQPRAFGNGVLPDYLAMYDVDESGDLSTEELEALNADRTRPDRHLKFRDQWDADRDGRISLEERKAAQVEIRRRILQRRSQRFDAVDTGVDGVGATDGFLTETEFSNISAVAASNLTKPGIATELFNHLDRDNDGRVSKREFLASLDRIRPEDDEVVEPKPRTKAELDTATGTTAPGTDTRN